MLAAAGIVGSCSDSINAADTNFGSKTSVQSLGITNRPITAAQAQQIAEKETGGTTIEVETDKEDGVKVFDVKLRVGNETKVEIKEAIIRASDGAVLSVLLDDDQDGDSESDGDNGDEGADSDGGINQPDGDNNP